MSKYTPEEIAANQARINRRPDGARIVMAPYDLSDVCGHAIKKGTPVWSYPSGRQAGGPMDAYAVGPRITEYSYRCLESARRKGWTHDWQPVTPEGHFLCSRCGLLVNDDTPGHDAVMAQPCQQ